ncbi:ABC transporter permease [Planctomycetota bacterium]|nr:ABC transporter permease [Planctomycetota bacterium]
MFAYIIRRIFQMGLTLVAISIIAFLVIVLAPGDPYASQLDPKAKPADIERQRDQMGYDDPVVQKYFTFYGQFFSDLGAVVGGDDNYEWKLKSNKTKEPVLPTMWRKMLITLPLVLLTTLIAWTLSFPIGIYTALKRGSWIDKITTVLAFTMISIPGFWLAIKAVEFVSTTLERPMVSPNSLGVELFGFSHFMDSVWHLAIPAIIGAFAGVAVLTRYVKGQFLEVNGQDYIRTAKAKGLDSDSVYYKHALRNTSLPFITMLSGLLPSLFGGSIVTEAIFGWPGLGRWVFEATIGKDLFIVMTSLFVGSALTLFGILVSDILYSVADPRVKLA